MKTTNILELLGGAVVAVILLILTVNATIGWSWMDSANAPAWVQAVGSVVAIAVAVGLARSDQRQRQRKELVVAHVVAAKLITKVAASRAVLRATAELIAKGPIGRSERLAQLEVVAEMLPDAEMVSDEDAQKLCGSGRATGIALADAAGKVAFVIRFVASLRENDHLTDEEFERRALSARRMLLMAGNLLEEAGEDMQALSDDFKSAALRRDHVRPPVQ